jgi:hypothetical protein
MPASSADISKTLTSRGYQMYRQRASQPSRWFRISFETISPEKFNTRATKIDRPVKIELGGPDLTYQYLALGRFAVIVLNTRPRLTLFMQRHTDSLGMNGIFNWISFSRKRKALSKLRSTFFCMDSPRSPALSTELRLSFNSSRRSQSYPLSIS